MVWMSMIGVSSGNPAIEVERASVSANFPSTRRALHAHQQRPEMGHGEFGDR
jgi:hypothetical protein